MELHPDELRRIFALVLLSLGIVLASVTMTYWPKDQAMARISIRDRTPGERYVLGEPLDLNRASEEELELLPGVGPKLARRLHKGAPYGSIEEVDAIKGVGPKLYERLTREAIVPATPPASPAR